MESRQYNTMGYCSEFNMRVSVRWRAHARCYEKQQKLYRTTGFNSTNEQQQQQQQKQLVPPIYRLTYIKLKIRHSKHSFCFFFFYIIIVIGVNFFRDISSLISLMLLLLSASLRLMCVFWCVRNVCVEMESSEILCIFSLSSTK